MRISGKILATFFILLSTPAFAQQIAPNIPPVIAQKNVTLIYNTSTGQPDSVVIDANNLDDPSFTQPGTRQINIPVATYNAIPDAPTFQTYMSTVISNDIAVQGITIQ